MGRDSNLSTLSVDNTKSATWDLANLSFTGTTESTSTTTGTITTAGGIGAAKNINSGEAIKAATTLEAAGHSTSGGLILSDESGNRYKIYIEAGVLKMMLL